MSPWPHLPSIHAHTQVESLEKELLEEKKRQRHLFAAERAAEKEREEQAAAAGDVELRVDVSDGLLYTKVCVALHTVCVCVCVQST